MWTALPEIDEPDLLIELETITAMYGGSGPAGGCGLLPGPVVQFVPQFTVTGVFSKPLNAAGAVPPVRPFNFQHCEPQPGTAVPTVAFWFPITQFPPAEAP